jgi:hypothetical protein
MSSESNEQPSIPLILLSPLSSYSATIVEHINNVFRSGQAEVQWVDKVPVDESFGFEPFELCKLTTWVGPLWTRSGFGRCVVLVANKDVPNDLLSVDHILWFPPLDDCDMSTVDLFLQGAMPSTAVEKHNRALLFNELFEGCKGFCPNPNVRDVDHELLRLTKPKWVMPPVPADGEEKPLILLDIDGCIRYPRGAEFPTNKTSAINQINQWSRSGKAEVRWMTYWGERATVEYAPSVNLDWFKHGRDVFVEDPDKEVQVFRWVDRNPKQKIIWIDDEIMSYFDLYVSRNGNRVVLVDWLLEHPNLLMVQPHHACGMDAEDIQLVHDFLDGKMSDQAVLDQNHKVMCRKRKREPSDESDEAGVAAAAVPTEE